MNHLTKIAAGTLSAAQLEQHIEEIKRNIPRYHEVEKSPEVQEYLEKKAQINSREFQAYRKKCIETKYKDTKEYQTVKKHRSLSWSWAVLMYRLRTSNSSVKEYMAFAASTDYQLLADKEAVATDKRLQQMKKMDQSKRILNLRKAEKSAPIAEWLKLGEEIMTEDFRKRNDFWSNPKRWMTTEEYKVEVRYEELEKKEEIKFYLSVDPKQIAEWESYKTMFEDDFELSNLKNSAWEAGFWYPNPKMKTNHSYIHEMAAMNEGNNSEVSESALHIAVKKEDKTTPAWHEKQGFLLHDYHYTGDVMQTAKKFTMEEGLVLAKVKMQGKSNAAVFLATGKQMPLIQLMNWDGRVLKAGVVADKAQESVTIEGAKLNDWLIYAARVEKKQVTFYINNQEILRAPLAEGEKYYLSMMNYLAQGNEETGVLSVDWVRVYAK